MQPIQVPGPTEITPDSRRSDAERLAERLDVGAVGLLIDGVAGNDPRQLSDLLTGLWQGGTKEQARYVLTAALVCRDPLSDLGHICTNALQTLADLNTLLCIEHWVSPATALGHYPNACALLNACDDRIASLTPTKQVPYKAIRQRLEQAAVLERTAQGAKIQAIAGLRTARCPGIWQLYERYRDTK